MFEKLFSVGNEYKLKPGDVCAWCGEIIQGDFTEVFNELSDVKGFDEEVTRELFCDKPCYLQAVSEWEPRNIEALKKKTEEKKKILLEKRLEERRNKEAILLNEGLGCMDSPNKT